MKRSSHSAHVHICDTDPLSRERQRLAGRIPVASLHRLASQLVSSEGELEYQLQGEVDEQKRPAATLRVRGLLTQRCDLCEQDVPLPLDVEARYWFVRDEAALDALPLEGDDEREPLVGGRRFDVAALVEDEAILALPISPRHAACEARLAQRDARAGAGEEDGHAPAGPVEGDRDRPNPFAVLASIRKRGSR